MTLLSQINDIITTGVKNITNAREFKGSNSARTVFEWIVARTVAEVAKAREAELWKKLVKDKLMPDLKKVKYDEDTVIFNEDGIRVAVEVGTPRSMFKAAEARKALLLSGVDEKLVDAAWQKADAQTAKPQSIAITIADDDSVE